MRAVALGAGRDGCFFVVVGWRKVAFLGGRYPAWQVPISFDNEGNQPAKRGEGAGESGGGSYFVFGRGRCGRSTSSRKQTYSLFEPPAQAHIFSRCILLVCAK